MTLRKHKLHFELWGLLTFFAVMLPNLIWFAVPAPDDKLRTDSITGAIDAAGFRLSSGDDLRVVLHYLRSCQFFALTGKDRCERNGRNQMIEKYYDHSGLKYYEIENNLQPFVCIHM